MHILFIHLNTRGSTIETPFCIQYLDKIAIGPVSAFVSTYAPPAAFAICPFRFAFIAASFTSIAPSNPPSK